MIYNKFSIIGLMLWLRYGLGFFRPWRSLKSIYAQYLESPCTKAYSRQEALILFADFTHVEISTPLGHGDLLTSAAGQRHRGLVFSLARLLWPRWFISTFFPQSGLTMLITAYK